VSPFSGGEEGDEEGKGEGEPERELYLQIFFTMSMKPMSTVEPPITVLEKHW